IFVSIVPSSILVILERYKIIYVMSSIFLHIRQQNWKMSKLEAREFIPSLRIVMKRTSNFWQHGVKYQSHDSATNC
ncbi:MAG: hypothetical protein J7K33_11205, partial [Candidatus Marinimicrobia bacterium]|nr:hypothetical protein [Candidatus Neomarinimicrobiota bacterium]